MTGPDRSSLLLVGERNTRPEPGWDFLSAPSSWFRYPEVPESSRALTVPRDNEQPLLARHCHERARVIWREFEDERTRLNKALAAQVDPKATFAFDLTRNRPRQTFGAGGE